MQINVTYDNDPNIAPPPAGFEATVQYAVDVLDATFTNDVMMNVVIGWNMFDGHHLIGTGEDGINLYTPLTYSYSDIRSALIAHATSPAQQAAFATLPSVDPTGGGLYELPSAEAKALGLTIPDGTPTTDSWVGVNPLTNWSYDPTHAPGPGQVDLVALIEHEITESMGRNSYLGTVSPDSKLSVYGIEDLFRYSAANTPQLTPGAPDSTGYFSVDNGVHPLGVWNNDPNAGDLGDWNVDPTYQGPGPGGEDSFDNAGDFHVFQPLTQTDLTLMQILGWDLANPPNVVINGETYYVAGGQQGAANLVIEPGGTLYQDLHGRLSGPVTFDGPGGLFDINNDIAPNAAIKGFVAGDTIDFIAAPIGAHPTVTLLPGNILEIVEHNTTYDFKLDPNQDFTGQSFHVTGDGQGGTLIFIDPSVQSVTTSGPGITNGNGDLDAGHTVTFSLNMNEAVDVDTTNGVPTLSLNDGGVATYSGGSGTNALTFSYTVANGENTPDLAVTAFNPHGSTAQDANGHAVDFSGAVVNPAGTLQIDTTPPHVTGASLAPAAGSLEWVFSFDKPVEATSDATLLWGELTVDTAATAALHDPTKLVFAFNAAHGFDFASAPAGYSDGITDFAGNAPVHSAPLPPLLAIASIIGEAVDHLEDFFHLPASTADTNSLLTGAVLNLSPQPPPAPAISGAPSSVLESIENAVHTALAPSGLGHGLFHLLV